MTKLGEPIATNIIRILSSAMPPILQKITAEYATLDGSGLPGAALTAVPLPPIKNYLLGERLMLPDCPAIIVDPRRAQIDSERFHFQWADYDHTVHIDVVVESDSEDIITRQVLRYARAIWEVLFGNQIDLVGNQVAAISLRPVTGGQTDLIREQESNLLYRGWKWIFEVHRYDDLT